MSRYVLLRTGERDVPRATNEVGFRDIIRFPIFGAN